MNEDYKKSRTAEILNILHLEPSSHEHRPLVVEYINIFLDKAKSLSSEDLYGREGHGIAMDLIRVLALQGLYGSGGYDWITEDEEPVIYEMQYYASQLDEASNKPEVWNQLFDLANKL